MVVYVDKARTPVDCSAAAVATLQIIEWRSSGWWYVLLPARAPQTPPSLRTTEDGSEVAAQQQLSRAFKTFLSSYTQGITRQRGRRGSLWWAKTKGKPVYFDFGPDQAVIKPAGPLAELRPYLHTCFHYIHRNPVKAKYVNHPGEWEFSSALDYMGLRASKLCNFALTEELLGITSNSY